jgi:hypothetical protein
MAIEVDWLQPAKPTFHRLARRTRRGCPAGHWETDRLAKVIDSWFHTASEYVAMREDVVSPTRPPLKGMPRLNALPTTDAHCKRSHRKPVKLPTPFKPTVRHFTEIAPQNIIPS